MSGLLVVALLSALVLLGKVSTSTAAQSGSAELQSATAEKALNSQETPQACPDVALYRARLAGMIDYALRQPDTPLAVKFAELSDKRISGQVSFPRGAADRFLRQVDGDECAEVMDALLFSVELALDEIRSIARRKDRTRYGAAWPGWPGPDIDPFSLPPARLAGSVVDIAPRGPKVPRLGMHAGAGVGFEVLPAPSVMFQAGLQFRLTRTLLLANTLEYHSAAISRTIETAGEARVGAYFSYVGGGLFLDWRFLHSQHLDLDLGFGPQAGVLLAEALGLGGPNDGWTLGISSHAVAAIKFPPGWRLGLRLSAQAALVRAKFLDAQTDELVWEQPVGAGTLGIFFGAEFF